MNLTAVGAKLTKDTEMFGKMDPYLIIDIKGKKQQTKVHDNGGKLPVWNQTF